MILHIVLLLFIHVEGNISDGGKPGASENRINIHFVRYTSHLSEILALFVFLPILRLLKKKHRCLIGINIYFVRNTHLLHRRNIICGTEDTWLSQNRDTYCWMRQSCMITYFSNIFSQIWNILLPVNANISNFIKNFWIHIFFTSKNLAHIWKWKFL